MKAMNERHRLSRRDIAKLLSGLASGLGFPSLHLQAAAAADAPTIASDPPDLSYLGRGLNALARAHHMSSMAGHLGASLIAGYFVGRQRPKLAPEVFAGIEGDLRRVMDGKSVFGKTMSKKSKLNDPELFEPFPKQKPDESLIDGIAEGLEKGIDKPRQSGHNVIFASLAIRALKEYPEFATPAVVDGICKLMKMFEKQTPGSGYYGKQKGRIHGHKIKLPDNDATPLYDDITGMVLTVLDETIQLNPAVHRVGYGSLVHIINHAAAICDLADYGYGELIPRAVGSHRHHLRLWRNLPDVSDEEGPLQVSKFTPHLAEYWTSGNIPYDRALLTHRVKTMFGFDELAAAVDQKAKVKAAYDRLRYMM